MRPNQYACQWCSGQDCQWLRLVCKILGPQAHPPSYRSVLCQEGVFLPLCFLVFYRQAMVVWFVRWPFSCSATGNSIWFGGCQLKSYLISVVISLVCPLRVVRRHLPSHLVSGTSIGPLASLCWNCVSPKKMDFTLVPNVKESVDQLRRTPHNSSCKRNYSPFGCLNA